ncbi:hypothetical protein [Inhella inkyongensis]|uniref:hypothetical protein n=1 Tax=Inhella inkyongensis TaxID=392593 RepID=UPI00110F2B96|nr:hypothetical protein [Inhella inkyongensis]
MTPPTIADLLKYADLQMAAEAFLVATNDPAKTPFKGQALIDALTEGNKHASRFTKAQAEHFEKHWAVEAQQSNTRTGFSGTVFRCHTDAPLTGAKAGEVVMCFRSTEFVDDAARDNESTNVLEIKETGFAWGQLRDMEAWYQQLIQDGKLAEGQFSLTGYSLGGHLASAFNEMHPTAAKQVVTFNGAGIGAVDPTKKLSTLLTQFSDLTKPNADGSAKFSFSHPVLSAIYERTRAAGCLISQADKNTLAAFILDARRDATPASDVAEAEWLQFANQSDVLQGHTSPSAVANLQNHVGKDVRVFIEDQPLDRGNVVTAAVAESVAVNEQRYANAA